jgi:hypothetical protein
MKLTWRDGLATLLVAATGILYGFYVTLGGVGPSWIGVQDATGMAAVGLGVGVIIVALTMDITAGASAAFRALVSSVRLVSVALGLLALFGENLFSAGVWEGVLAAFMGSIAVVWAISMARHAGLIASRSVSGSPTGFKPV